jgi:hypothetical protein
LNKCFDCGEPAKADEKFCVKCRWAKRNRNTDKQSPASAASSKTQKNKAAWITGGIVVFFVFLSGIFSSADSTSSGPGSAETQAQVALEATFYDAGTVPFFVGRTAESAAIIMRDKFDEQFSNIRNKDTDRDISPYFRSKRDLRDLEGLFVCSQSIAPGADLPDYAFGYLKIEVSENCANKEVSFAMGPAAMQIGQFVPASIDQECYSTDNCDLPQMDGVVVGFLEEGFRSHKTVIVETGVGVMEVELALIDLSDEWCEFNDAESQSIKEKAIEERNKLLPIGSFVRLVLTKGLYGDERFVHRLSSAGTYTDGEPPNFSVNELLVSSGYWLPEDDAGSHEWERVYSVRQKLENATWKTSNYSYSDDLFAAYQKRIVKAANLAFTEPNPILSTCLQAKEKEVLAVYKEDEDDRRRSAAVANKRASDIEAVWRSVFCADGGTEDYPERCKNYNPAVDDKVGAGSGGGSNCTWVRGHSRSGSSVKGHVRCR